MSLLPDYLIILIVVLVIVPAVVAILLRMILHYYLVNQGNKVWRLVYGKSVATKPKLVQHLESRLAQTRKELEQVNTGALIDHAYSQERVLLISCEQIDYFCRILPNLLISLGLLGTFIGITINLAALSQTVSQTNITDISLLLQELQKPLQGMGIAFITSLSAILFSAFLTVVNFLFNTNLAKARLLSGLEDYLDNIYQPTLQGETHIDRVVQGLIHSFDQFLHRFGQTVQHSVESALQEKIQTVSQAQITTHQLAEQVYSRLVEASAKVTQSANDFQLAANGFMEAAHTFDQSQFSQTLSQATTSLGNTQRNFSQSAASLATSVQSIDLAMIELQNYSKRLMKFGDKLNQNHQTTVDLMDSHHQNQQALSEMIQQFQNASQAFQLGVNSLELLQRRMVTRTDSLEEIQMDLSALVIAINRYTEGLNSGLDRLAQGIMNSSHQNNS